MATPHVAGVAALLASTRPEAGPQALASYLRQQADPLPSPDHQDDPAAFYGAGLVDALRAVSSRPD
jgi:subtilisin family serine protease